MAFQPNNLAHACASAPPIGNGLRGGGAPRLENRNRHNERKVSHADAYSTVADGVFWNFIDKRWQIVRHVTPLPTPGTEQLGNRRQGRCTVNERLFVPVAFLQTAGASVPFEDNGLAA